MKEEKYLFPVLIIVICIGTLLVLNFPSPEITNKVNPLIELYKDSISNMRKQAKLDTVIKESEVREDSTTNWRIIESKAIKTDTGRANKIKRFMEINYRK